MALSKGNWDLAVFFLNKGANVNIPNFSNAYPLHLAVQGNQVEMVRALLMRGAEMGTRANEYDNNDASSTVRIIPQRQNCKKSSVEECIFDYIAFHFEWRFKTKTRSSFLAFLPAAILFYVPISTSTKCNIS